MTQGDSSEIRQDADSGLRSALDAALEGCVIVDFNWRYLYANDAAAKLMQRLKQERIGRTMMEVFPGIEKQDGFAHLEACMQKRVAEHFETEFTLPEGNKVWLEVRAEPVPQGMLLFYVDITERKNTERRLKSGVDRLEHIYHSAQVSTVKPVGLLMIEHRLIERVIALLAGEKARMEKTNEVDLAFIDYVADFLTTYSDKTHNCKEENVLFKELAAKPLTAEQKNTIDGLVQDHAVARKLVESLVDARARWAAGNKGAIEQVIAAADGLVKLYPPHIEKEDKLLFQPVAQYFSPQETDDMLLQFWESDRQTLHRRFAEETETLSKMQNRTPPA